MLEDFKEYHDYLNELENNLILLDADIVEEIIENYKTRFAISKSYEGKEFSDIIRELGSPKELAANIYSAYGVKDKSWESSRDAKSSAATKFKAILFDVFIAGIAIPVLLLTLMSAIGLFTNFPIMIRNAFAFEALETVLLIALIIGLYLVLFVLVVLFAEIFLLAGRKLVSYNIKAFTPQYQTTARLVNGISIVRLFRNLRVGKTTIVTFLSVFLSIVSFSFIVLFRYNPELITSFGTIPELSENTMEVVTNLNQDEAYDVIVSVGQTDVTLARTTGNSITFSHTYNADDQLDYNIIDDSKIIAITANRNVDAGMFNDYEGSVVVNIPRDLNIKNILVETSSGNVSVFDFYAKDFTVSTSSGNITVVDVEVNNSNLTSDTGDIYMKSSTTDNAKIINSDGVVILEDINNLLRVGTKLELSNVSKGVFLHNFYFDSNNIYSVNSDILYSYETERFNPKEFFVDSENGIYSFTGNVKMKSMLTS